LEGPLTLPESFRYDAYISCADAAAATAVQAFIEGYRLPLDASGDSRKLLLARGGPDAGIDKALVESAHLLLLATSPAALQSAKVHEEVEAFRALRPDAIIPVTDLQWPHGWRRAFSATEQIELVRIIARLTGIDVNLLLAWHEERRKNRHLRLVAAALGGTTLLAALGAGGLAQRHGTEREQLQAQAQRDRAALEVQQQAVTQSRKHGESALAMHGSGLFAPAASAFGRLPPAALALDGGIYAQAARFLQPRLLSFDEATRTLRPGEALRWRDSNILRGPDGLLREVGGRPIVAHQFAPAGSPLLAIDADRQAWVYQWPTLATAGPHRLGSLCVEGIEVLPDGQYAVNATEIPVASGQDTAAAPGLGRPVRIVLARDGRPGAPMPREATGTSKCAPAAGRREPSVPAVRGLRFPRLREEAAFWREAPRREPAKAVPSVVPLDVHPRPPFGELDPQALKGTADERSALRRHLGDEALTTGLVLLDGRSIALSQHLNGNQSTALNLCEFQPATRKLLACGMVPMNAAATPLFSANHRRLLLTMTQAQEDPFKLLDVGRLGARCKVAQHPGERVVAAAFNAGGDRLALVTLDHELWLYELAADCEARLAVRQALPAQREDGRSSLGWLDAHTVVWMAGQGETFAFEARSGQLRWAQHSVWPLRPAGVKVRPSDDGKLFVLFNQHFLQLASATSGVALSGLLDVRSLQAAGQKPGGDICDVEVSRTGEVWLRIGAGTCASGNGDATGRTQWRRLAPDDPALGFDTKPGLWRRTAISEKDGRSPLALQEFLTR
jgi:hypothetical protein